MRHLVDECSELMGETGQGLNSEEEIKKDQNTHLTRTWGVSDVSWLDHEC